MTINQTMPYDAGEIKNINQVIKVATTLSMSWLRGHPEEYWKLTPKIFRSGPEYSQEYIQKDLNS